MRIDLSKLTSHQRQYRMNIRNGFLDATKQELEQSLENAHHDNDQIKVKCLEELADELEAEESIVRALDAILSNEELEMMTPEEAEAEHQASLDADHTGYDHNAPIA